MPLYEHTGKKLTRDWIAELDTATLNFLFNKFVNQKRVVYENNKPRVVRFASVIKMLNDDHGPVSPALTGSDYISHEVRDIVMRAIIGVLEDRHEIQVPKEPINFAQFTHLLLNDIAGSQLFKTNQHAIDYKYGKEFEKGQTKPKAKKHINLNDDDLGTIGEGEITEASDNGSGFYLEMEEVRKGLTAKDEQLSLIFELSLQGYKGAEVADILSISKTKAFDLINKVKAEIREILDVPKPEKKSKQNVKPEAEA